MESVESIGGVGDAEGVGVSWDSIQVGSVGIRMIFGDIRGKKFITVVGNIGLSRVIRVNRAITILDQYAYHAYKGLLG